MSLKIKVQDTASAIYLTLGSMFLRWVGSNIQNLPRSRAVLDRLNIVLQNRTFYRPFISRRDLRRSLRDARDLPGLRLDKTAQLKELRSLTAARELDLPIVPPDELSFGYKNGTYGEGDAEILYGMVRKYKPRRLIEIGSGHSTKLVTQAIRKTVEDDPDYACEHLCIEPFMNPWLEQLGVNVIREKVETLDLSLFQSLCPSDILFIDSSHVIRPQGDVLFEYLEILPTLPPGVLVHIHDIFTPFDYLEKWVIDWQLVWNEQYLLEAFLSGNPDYEILLATNWLSREEPDAMKEMFPGFRTFPHSEPSSFWVRRRA